MSKLKKTRNIVISSLLSLVLVGSAALLPYYQVKAEAITGVIGVASSGVALLSLLALSGVGMELENNRKFNDLTDEEKTRLENGLAQNFEDVALQRGMALEKIKSWTSDLCNGVLDKASDCWGIFKDWAKSVTLANGGWKEGVDYQYGASVPVENLLGFTYNGYTITQSDIDYIKSTGGSGDNIGWQIQKPLGGGYKFRITKINNNSSSSIINQNNSTLTWNVFNNGGLSNSTSGSFNNYISNFNNYNIMMKATKPVKLRDLNGVVSDLDYNGVGVSASNFFRTNTDYLERLKGQESDVVEVIDVTDIKHPIIESVPNTKSELSYNKGFKRPSPDDNDDDVVVGGLVPTNVFYESLDDYNEGLRNEVVEYDQNIQENPENQDKIFVSPTPIINVNNIYNTLPVVNTPISNTVINNNYTYNNTYNKNVTINELPYNADLIPYLPTMLFENKFPFCIPFDIYTLFSVFYVEREAPEFTFDVPFPSANGLEVQQITLGLKDFEYCALVLRIMWYFLFLLGLMLISRKLIKG